MLTAVPVCQSFCQSICPTPFPVTTYEQVHLDTPSCPGPGPEDMFKLLNLGPGPAPRYIQTCSLGKARDWPSTSNAKVASFFTPLSLDLE